MWIVDILALGWRRAAAASLGVHQDRHRANLKVFIRSDGYGTSRIEPDAMLGPLGTAFIRICNSQHLSLCRNFVGCVRDHARYLRPPTPTAWSRA
jgi:hypothetical protein